MLKLKPKLVFFCFASVLALSLAACALASNLPSEFAQCTDHQRYQSQGFSFSAGQESPDILVLDYFYGVPNCPSIRNPDQFKNRGESMQGENQIGTMRRAQKLYVKWRIKATGQEFEDTVDLRERLPKDMTGYRVHFSIRGSQLYVYLVTPEFLPPGAPLGSVDGYRGFKTFTIYPNEK